MAKVWDKETGDWVEVGNNALEAVANDPERYSLTKPEAAESEGGHATGNARRNRGNR